jgi:hypothetical protein
MGRPTGIVAASKVCVAHAPQPPHQCLCARRRDAPASHCQHLFMTPCAMRLQDKALARIVQRLFASPSMRVNTTSGEPGRWPLPAHRKTTSQHDRTCSGSPRLQQ